MRKWNTTALCFGAALLVACGDDGGSGGDLFPPKPECEGAAVTAFAGMQPQVIRTLEIGGADDGFDLDRDGDPDNKLAAVSSLAKSAIDDALKDYSIIIPFEFFDLAAAAPDTCVKFAIYLGAYVVDGDGDGKKPYVEGGDCNDTDMAISPGATENVGNFKDDDCDGLADEDAQNNPSTSTQDRDGDGQSMKDGDCDDTNPMIKTGMAEICGDGLDNDCDGVADRTVRAGLEPACSPFDTSALAEIPIDVRSFVDQNPAGDPAITFKDGVISMQDGKLVLDAGPSLFSVNIPVTDGIALDLRITGATIKADVVEDNGAIVLRNGHLGGVIDSKTADTIRGLDVEQIGLTPENSLLDATFANLLGPLLALPKAKASVLEKYDNCRTPDIDVDQDGLEAFCDSNPDDTNKAVDRCIDGDGTEVEDVLDGSGAVIMQCSEAMKGDKFRFVDGISVELNFETSQVSKLTPAPPLP
ncbi:MAG TPA: putative metal-binding motif-containing protein [Kofleriaceae bacterium]|nr:putative metal-binding motif-containing protein [Kofleriaceae bacterium]